MTEGGMTRELTRRAWLGCVLELLLYIFWKCSGRKMPVRISTFLQKQYILQKEDSLTQG